MLIVAWIASVPVVNILDHLLKHALYGGSADGGATILAMPAIVPTLIVASFLKRRWWVAAVIGELCAPVAITAMYLLWR